MRGLLSIEELTHLMSGFSIDRHIFEIWTQETDPQQQRSIVMTHFGGTYLLIEEINTYLSRCLASEDFPDPHFQNMKVAIECVAQIRRHYLEARDIAVKMRDVIRELTKFKQRLTHEESPYRKLLGNDVFTQIFGSDGSDGSDGGIYKRLVTRLENEMSDRGVQSSSLQ